MSPEFKIAWMGFWFGMAGVFFARVIYLLIKRDK